MELEKFKKIINLQAEQYQKQQKLYKLGIDLIEINDPLELVISELWAELLTNEGYNWLSWFLYEYYWISGDPKLEIKAWDEEGTEIIKTTEELHEYLTVNSYFRAKKV